MRSAKAAINEGLETDLASGMKVEEKHYAEVSFVADSAAAVHRSLSMMP